VKYPIPILLYHRIEDSSASTATSPSVFRKHLELLRDNGWKSLSSDEFAYYMKTGRAVPFRSFLLTFDDGHESISTVALNILKEFDFKAISFLCTAYLRGPQHGESLPLPPGDSTFYLSWEQVRELQSSGIIDCQSHSHSHTRFDDRSLGDIKQDLGTSVELLSKELRLPRSHFTHFAWPWGLSTPEWRAAAASTGFSYQYGVARMSCTLDSRLDQIPRICFDASSFEVFQMQLWLQTGYLSQVWNIAYPIGRRLRHLVSSAAH
jgi:peptidoglycan/xylan/chitin deacetylase (PgdA/CDA1 family)